MLQGKGPASVRQLVDGDGMPSCPLSPRPQQKAAPFDVSAQVWAPPAAMAAKLADEIEITETTTMPLSPSDVAEMTAVPARELLSRPAADTATIDESVV